MALMPTRENGPAARSFAADAYDCIMVRIKRSYRIQVCGTKMRSHGELPSDPQQTDRQVPSRHRTYTKSPGAVHRPFACSGVKALRNTSAARRQAAKRCYRFGPLTPSARSANLIAGDGTKNGFPAPNKEPTTTQKLLLDRKSPIQVRIPFPPASSQRLAGIRPPHVEKSGVSRGCVRTGLSRRWSKTAKGWSDDRHEPSSRIVSRPTGHAARRRRAVEWPW